MGGGAGGDISVLLMQLHSLLLGFVTAFLFWSFFFFWAGLSRFAVQFFIFNWATFSGWIRSLESFHISAQQSDTFVCFFFTLLQVAVQRHCYYYYFFL